MPSAVPHLGAVSSTMKIPYNRVLVMGDVLFAARGAGILSFSLRDGSHLSTWAHPSVHEAVPERVKPELENASIRSQQGQGEEADRGPPAKKQRLGGGHDNERQQPPPPGPDEAGEPASLSGTNTNGGGPGGGANTKSGTRNREVKAPSSVSRVPERPVVTQLTGTTDGKHVVATTAHDKVIWVFEHDGAGRLVQLTQRRDSQFHMCSSRMLTGGAAQDNAQAAQLASHLSRRAHY